MDRDKIREATNQAKTMFKVYFTLIVVIFVGATILSSQKIIDVVPNDILLGSAIVIGVIMVAYQGYMTKLHRDSKKLAQ